MKKKFMKIFVILLFMVLGAVFGFVIAKVNIEAFGKKEGIITIIVSFLILFLAFIIQVILHEAGHLIFGMLTGYKFVSFRIGSFMFVRENQKIKLKKYKVMGIIGQCIMMSPKGNKFDYPYMLYNLGGVIINFLFSILSVILYVFMPMNTLFKIFFIGSFIIGIYFVCANGIPVKIGEGNNDGYNLLSMKKDKTIRYAFYIQLQVNALIHEGKRLKDIDVSWDKCFKDVDLNNPIITGIKLLESSYYEDKKEFEKSKKILVDLKNNTSHLILVYKNEIDCELLFYEIIGECRMEVVEKLYTKELKKYITLTNSYVSRSKLMYAYALIIEKDKNKAEEIFNKMISFRYKYPIQSEVDSVFEIMESLKEKYV